MKPVRRIRKLVIIDLLNIEQNKFHNGHNNVVVEKQIDFSLSAILMHIYKVKIQSIFHYAFFPRSQLLATERYTQAANHHVDQNINTVSNRLSHRGVLKSLIIT